MAAMAREHPMMSFSIRALSSTLTQGFREQMQLMLRTKYKNLCTLFVVLLMITLCTVLVRIPSSKAQIGNQQLVVFSPGEEIKAEPFNDNFSLLQNGIDQNTIRIAALEARVAALEVVVGAPPPPDLVVTPPTVCNNVITIRNVGGSAAPASRTRIDFGQVGNPILVSIPALGPGEEFDATVALPGSCFNPNCDFTIFVDTDNTVTEGAAGEANNTVVGSCLG